MLLLIDKGIYAQYIVTLLLEIIVLGLNLEHWHLDFYLYKYRNCYIMK